jgi:hypothetical protein
MPSDDGNKSGHTPEAAHFIASFAGELARIAKSHDLETLAYILDMARLEADQLAKGWRSPS